MRWLWHTSIAFLLCGWAIASAQTTSPKMSSTTNPAPTAGGFPFRAVFIDPATEKQFGPFPYDRAFLARGIRAFNKAGARAIILKFFLDRPKSPDGDNDLAKAIADSKAKIILEACLNQSETNPNPLPISFTFDVPKVRGSVPIGGDVGWIPQQIFAEHADQVGFVDIHDLLDAPVLEFYKGRHVKSLFTCAIEAGLNETAHFVAGHSLTIAHRTIDLTARSEIAIDFPAQDTIESYSYADVLNGTSPKDSFKDRVVILGWDSTRTPTVETKIGRVGIHRWFWHMLKSAYEKVAAWPLDNSFH